ncbi:hypothetical protein F4777DRAFT_578359 [Nemania sp. FL0916]|nr:hypothetical protein F4777DRAFT_578359 [Nemania sp. FL0916]
MALPDLITQDLWDKDLKLIDFCLTIEPDHLDRVNSILYHQPNHRLWTLNQTMYTPLCFRPIAIAAITETEAPVLSADRRLGTWINAWFNRMRLLLNLPHDTSPTSLPFPLIRIRGHDWYVNIAYLEGYERTFTGDSTADTNGTHTNGTHTNGTHKNGTHKNGAHANGAHANGTPTNGAHTNMKVQSERLKWDQESYQSCQTLRDRQSAQYWHHMFDRAPTDCAPIPYFLPEERKLIILSEQAIGDTRTIPGVYRLLKSIRILVDFAETDFRQYINYDVIPAAEQCWVAPHMAEQWADLTPGDGAIRRGNSL